MESLYYIILLKKGKRKLHELLKNLNKASGFDKVGCLVNDFMLRSLLITTNYIPYLKSETNSASYFGFLRVHCKFYTKDNQFIANFIVGNKLA